MSALPVLPAELLVSDPDGQRVLMIDNFDSFTWNLYQQISILGAKVTVLRNNAITAEQFPFLKIDFLIVSPGPGHPKTDSGISKEAITYFTGKIPVLGVCMGLECLVDLHGGEIAYVGEIKHGKPSRVRHDGRGCFKGVPQLISSTRYHSLGASISTLPDILAVTSTTEDSGVIMGVRHRKYTLEAVQYHPESILSEGGNALIKNFLGLRGGTWDLNPESGVLDTTLPPFAVEALPAEALSDASVTRKIPSILDKIYIQRLADVAKAQSTPGSTLADLQTLLSLNIAPPLISFVDRLKQPNQPALLAEIKRASPSKGPIALTTSPASQALTYALSGAHAISVLTEPTHFLGVLPDMLHARTAVNNLPNRPAILRKDFILSRYQVLESRLWGADTLLLIVAMLPPALLLDLYKYSQSLGMEPLVEVNNASEMTLALDMGAKVIGVNNRNLHDFNVDMGTTTRLSEMVKGRKGVILCALSGIGSRSDVRKYVREGVSAVLVGESLMRAKDTKAFIRELLSSSSSNAAESSSTAVTPQWRAHAPLVKICGIRTVDEALGSAAAGADMLGLNFVSTSIRFLTLEKAAEIATAVRTLPSTASSIPGNSNIPTPWFTSHADRVSSAKHTRPLLVGVFQNAPLETIQHVVSVVGLDMVQLHGTEPVHEWSKHIPVPVIGVVHGEQGGIGQGLSGGEGGFTRGGGPMFLLVDGVKKVPPPPVEESSKGREEETEKVVETKLSGGTASLVDWDWARRVVDSGEIVTSGPNVYDAPPEEVVEKTETVEGEAATTASITEETNSSPYPLPIILAGGLSPSNVAEAISAVHPWAVDVAGGVEYTDKSGKDMEMVRNFVASAKGLASYDAASKEQAEEEEQPSTVKDVLENQGSGEGVDGLA